MPRRGQYSRAADTARISAGFGIKAVRLLYSGARCQRSFTMTSSWRSSQTGVIDIRFMRRRAGRELARVRERIDRDLRGVEGADGQLVELRVEVDHLFPSAWLGRYGRA